MDAVADKPSRRKNRSRRVLLFASFVFALLAVAISFSYHDGLDRGQPYGTKTVFRIDKVPDSLNRKAVLAAITNVATATDSTVYKQSVDPARPDSGRILYVFSPSSTGRERPSDREYAAFGHTYRTELRPASAITTQDMRGIYASTADDRTIQAGLEGLRSQGIEVRQITAEPTGPVAALTANQGALLYPALVMAALMVLVGAVHGANGAGTIAVRTVNGMSRGRATTLEVGRGLAVYSLVLLGTLLLSSGALLFYNGLSQFGAFVQTYLSLALMGMVAVFVGNCIMLVRLGSFSLSSILDGKRPLGLVAGVAAIVQGAGLIGACLSLASGGTQVLALSRDAALDATWLSARGTVAVRWAGTNTPDELTALQSSFGDIVRSAESKGLLVLSRPAVIPPQLAKGYGPVDGNSLTVNATYLRTHPLRSDDGSTVSLGGEKLKGIHLLIPSNLGASSGQLVQQYQEWGDFQKSLQHSSANGEPTAVTFELIAPGQQVFNYGAAPYQDQPVQMSPVVAVVSASSGILSDDYFVAAASGGGALFTDAQWISNQIGARHLESNVSSITSVADIALEQRAERLTKLRTLTIGMVLLLVAVSLAAATFVRAYREINSKRIFVQEVHGQSFMQIHGNVVLSSVIAGVAIVSILGFTRAIDSIVGYIASLLAVVILVSTTLITLVLQRRDSVKQALARA